MFLRCGEERSDVTVSRGRRRSEAGMESEPGVLFAFASRLVAGSGVSRSREERPRWVVRARAAARRSGGVSHWPGQGRMGA